MGAIAYTIPFDMATREPLPEVYLALVPTAVGWQVLAFLRYGGWNDCPHADAHVCMFKRWKDLYGAEVVGMSHDVVEMQVARPPLERSTALNLAWEQYMYCADIVVKVLRL